MHNYTNLTFVYLFMRLLIILIFIAIFAGCALKIEVHTDKRDIWFQTNWYTSTEYCESICEPYKKFENEIHLKITPLCLCMDECTDGKINSDTDSTYCALPNQ